MIRYALIENSLTPDPRDRRASVLAISTKTMEDVVDKMISRGSTVTKAEALSVFEEFSLAIAQLVEEGHNIITPLFNIRVSITGVFVDVNDSYDASRHQLNVRVNPGPRLKEIVDHLKVEKVTATKPMPTLDVFRDITSKTENDVLTPGGVGKIFGSLLKFDTTKPEQGVFFTNATGAVTRVDTIVDASPSIITFVIPSTLVAGKYSVSVRSVINDTKDLREGFLIDDLTVK
jgi:hypothetical protein